MRVTPICMILLALLGLEIVARWAMETHWLFVQILGWLLWLITTTFIWAFVYVIVMRLFKHWRSRGTT